jgi:hypothetical protein
MTTLEIWLQAVERALASIANGLSIQHGEALILLLLFTSLYVISLWQIRRGRQIALRPIPAYTQISLFAAEAVEKGRPVHLSPGSGGLGDVNTMATLAGIDIVDALTGRPGVPPRVIASTADGLTLPVLQNAFERGGLRGDIFFFGPTPVAYAGGITSLLFMRRPWMNVITGAVGDEYLIVGETARRIPGRLIAGTSTVQQLPFLMVTADHGIIGEELFAARAYLTRRPANLASLLAQDRLRLLIILLISGGTLLVSLR